MTVEHQQTSEADFGDFGDWEYKNEWMSPVWMLMLFQSVILRLTETESTSSVGSLAHFHTLNHQNHQNQLQRFADLREDKIMEF